LTSHGRKPFVEPEKFWWEWQEEVCVLAEEGKYTEFIYREGFQLSQKRLWLLQQDDDRQSYLSQCVVLIEEIKCQILEVALQKGC